MIGLSTQTHVRVLIIHLKKIIVMKVLLDLLFHTLLVFLEQAVLQRVKNIGCIGSDSYSHASCFLWHCCWEYHLSSVICSVICAQMDPVTQEVPGLHIWIPPEKCRVSRIMLSNEPQIGDVVLLRSVPDLFPILLCHNLKLVLFLPTNCLFF